MKFSTKWLGLVIVGATAVTTLVACGHRFSSPDERAEYIVEKVNKKLTLDDIQNVKLNALKDVILATRQEFVSNRQQTHQSIKELLDQPTLERDRVLNMISEKTSNINQKAPTIVSALGDFYDSLTPDQQQILRDELNNRMEHHGKYWHH